LVRATYRWVNEVDEDHYTIYDALYRLIGEAFERFVPDAAFAVDEAYYRDEYDEGDAEREIEAVRDAYRRRAGARMIRRALEEGGES
jgi:hypothetical protein